MYILLKYSVNNNDNSLYSKPIAKWTSEEWEKHTKILKKLAKPKVAPEAPSPVVIHYVIKLYIILLILLITAP